MNLEHGIKRIIGFIVRNRLYNKAGIKQGLETLKSRAISTLGKIVRDTDPTANQVKPEMSVFVILVPKGVLGNIWEFHSVHGSMEIAHKVVESSFIKLLPQKKVVSMNIGNHTNWVYMEGNREIPVVTINEYKVKL